jgi:hypothetical protein
MAERPEFFPEWATQDTNLPNTGNVNKQRPKETLRTIGFDKGQEPSAEEFNWLFNNVGQWVEFLEQEIAEGISSTRDVNVNAGNGLTGGGSLAGDVTLTLGTPSTITTASTNNVTTTSHTHQIDLSGRAITGTNGLTGGGDLSANRTISLGTPSTITVSSTNTNAGSTHNHQIDLSGRSVSAGNGLTGGGDLSTNRTLTLGTPGTITNSTSNSVTSTSHTHSLDITGFFAGANHSLTPNGYQRFPGGLLIQWGRVSYADIAGVLETSITYPISFTTVVFHVSVVAETTQPGVTTSFRNPSTTNFIAVIKEFDTTVAGGFINWFAIGV